MAVIRIILRSPKLKLTMKSKCHINSINVAVVDDDFFVFSTNGKFSLFHFFSLFSFVKEVS